MANLYNEAGLTSDSSSPPALSTLSAFFDSRSNAEGTVDRLKDAGIPAESIRFMPGYEADRDEAAVAADNRPGFWASLADWFFPDEDRATYAEGLRRGGFLVSVSNIGDALYESAREILEEEGSINIDDRAEEWRREGWTGHTTGDALTTRAFGVSVPASKLGEGDIRPQGAEIHEDTFDAGSSDETIPLSEDNLGAAKRDINISTGRVRAYSLEQPVRRT